MGLAGDALREILTRKTCNSRIHYVLSVLANLAPTTVHYVFMNNILIFS